MTQQRNRDCEYGSDLTVRLTLSDLVHSHHMPVKLVSERGGIDGLTESEVVRAGK